MLDTWFCVLVLCHIPFLPEVDNVPLNSISISFVFSFSMNVSDSTTVPLIPVPLIVTKLRIGIIRSTLLMYAYVEIRIPKNLNAWMQKKPVILKYNQKFCNFRKTRKYRNFLTDYIRFYPFVSIKIFTTCVYITMQMINITLVINSDFM